MYVAVTRAEDILYLSESEGYLNDTGVMKYPSRFISEIPKEMLKTEGNPDESLFEGTRELVARLNLETSTDAEAHWPAGTSVVHKVFGEGIIEAYDAKVNTYRVRFGSKVRQLIPRVLVLKERT